MAGEQKFKRFHRINWRGVEKALDHFAFEVLELIDFVLGFSSLGDDFESQAVGQD
jgi:hypothetical protein